MKNTRTIKYLTMLFFGFNVASCGGGGGGDNPAPQPVILPISIYPLPEMKILVIGQSISSNCNEHVYGPENNVFQVGKNGEIKAASDPFEWADCRKGAMWIPLGKKLIDAGIAKKVVFMPIGVGGTKVEDWQEGGRAFAKLSSAISLVKARNVSFDFAFWYQGSSDTGTGKDVYAQKLGAILDYVDAKLTINRWLIAIHSRCNGTYDRDIEAAQLLVGNRTDLRHYIGPNNNLLGDEYRVDTCHLNWKGQEKMASMWLESVKLAIK